MLVSFVLLGVACGILWSQVVTPAEFTKVADGGAMGERDLGRQFAADGWFVAIGATAGLLAGLGLGWWRAGDPVRTTVLLVLGSAVAAALMAVVGQLLGPPDPEAALQAAELGAQVPERLDVDTFIVYLAWPVGVLAGALCVLLGEPTAREHDTDVRTDSA